MIERSYPEALKSLPIWILWKLETTDKGKKTKVPYSAKYPGRARSDLESTWDTYQSALNKLEANPLEYAGLGIMLSKKRKIIFIDIDHCVSYDGEETFLSETAKDILTRLSTQFIELSQSRTGLHILALGDIEKNTKNSKLGVEIYNEKRFVALTGMKLNDYGEPHEDPESIEYIYNKYRLNTERTEECLRPLLRARRSPILTDEEIVRRASRNAKFEALFRGDWSQYGSQSEGDLALCSFFAFWTERDPESIDRLFRASGLYRDKWERKDYRSETISKACKHCVQTYNDHKENFFHEYFSELNKWYGST